MLHLRGVLLVGFWISIFPNLGTAADTAPRYPIAGWSGFYVGASAGASFISLDSIGNRQNVNTSPFGTFTQTVNAIASGRDTGYVSDLYVGYNQQFGTRVIVGAQVEGGFAGNSINMRGVERILTVQRAPIPPELTTQDTLFTIPHRWSAAAFVRAGYLVSNDTLAYILAGWTYARFEISASDVLPNFGLHGPIVGAGIERKIAGHWTMRAEYRYSSFMDGDVGGTFRRTAQGVIPQTSTAVATGRFDAAAHTGRVGIAYYFHP
ncbi:MAG: outer membrane protein [Xanthobacteraceae bacterium]